MTKYSSLPSPVGARHATLLFALVCFSCGSSGTSDGPVLATATADEPSLGVDDVPAITRAQSEFYGKAFPLATHYAGKRIPKEMISSLNKGNEVYIVALDKDQETLGYLRDLSVPVTLGEECPCDPLNLTLAFDAEFGLLDILSAAPLTKKGHENFSNADMARLLELAKAPPPELLKARSAEQVVDVVSGATKPEFKEVVIDKAGLSTRRIVGLVRATQRILTGAPLAWDTQRFNAIVTKADSDKTKLAEGFAEFIPHAQSLDVGMQSFRVMVATYRSLLEDNASDTTFFLEKIETRILSPGLNDEVDPFETAQACYALANQGTRLNFVARCAKRLESSSVAGHVVSLLRGTTAYFAGDYTNAVQPLLEATSRFNLFDDPNLHLRYAVAAMNTGSGHQACETAKGLFTAHPLLPGVKKALQSCVQGDGDVVPVMQKIREVQKAQVLATRIASGPKVPTLNLETADMKEAEIVLNEKGKVTVAVFFATWCPHCRKEMPRINAFVNSIQKNSSLKDKVRVLGVRTAIEKESQAYGDFVKEFKPNFPIWVDPVMSLSFSKFAKSQNISAGIPTIAVIDEGGIVRFMIPAGDYRDTSRELLWAVSAAQ